MEEFRMKDFVLTKDKVPTICEKIGIENEQAASQLFSEFGIFYEEVRKQHLASIVRALEFHIRRITNQSEFKIRWEEINLKDFNVNFGVCLNYKKRNHRSIIAVPNNIGDREARIIVAHELGHIFCGTVFVRDRDLFHDAKAMHKLANLFTIFIC